MGILGLAGQGEGAFRVGAGFHSGFADPQVDSGASILSDQAVRANQAVYTAPRTAARNSVTSPAAVSLKMAAVSALESAWRRMALARALRTS